MKKANPINTTNAMGKKRKRPKNTHKTKKDEENILSKDLEDDNIRYMMDTKKNLKPRENSHFLLWAVLRVQGLSITL